MIYCQFFFSETCNVTLPEETGSFTSPGFPYKYPASKDCWWTINVAEGKKLSLKFTSIDVYSSRTSCNDDNVRVRMILIEMKNTQIKFCSFKMLQWP